MRHFTLRGTPRGRRFRLVTSAQLADLIENDEVVRVKRFNSWEGVELHGGVVIPPDPELSAELAKLTSHVAIDAWVQAHEANLPCRPDEWATYKLDAKKAWVLTHYA